MIFLSLKSGEAWLNQKLWRENWQQLTWNCHWIFAENVGQNNTERWEVMEIVEGKCYSIIGKCRSNCLLWSSSSIWMFLLLCTFWEPLSKPPPSKSHSKKCGVAWSSRSGLMCSNMRLISSDPRNPSVMLCLSLVDTIFAICDCDAHRRPQQSLAISETRHHNATLRFKVAMENR